MLLNFVEFIPLGLDEIYRIAVLDPSSRNTNCEMKLVEKYTTKGN